ncbi:M23 family metallopeptidase [Candidatus Daviesbacteria bacterium]|nr:M23 family metallopeptidase [Candidatus Daviesbacteria bacterium]MBI4035349.1 M23 family metallopeptidase [Candidatus Daviesbacteria bacterium]
MLIFLSGYYPTFTFPPLKSSQVRANTQEEKGEVVALSFPKPLVLPHPGYLSAKFYRWHPGVDIATGLGMPIHPITEGIIEDTGFGFWGYGNNVLISHANGFKSFYAHMGKIYVKKGQTVRSEDTLGEVGMTGHTSGPHTHLEITHNGNYIDPTTILPEIPTMPKIIVKK